MSGFSPELIDYLEGKISFEEFERRREERKTREKKVSCWAPVLFSPKQWRGLPRVGLGPLQLLPLLEMSIFTSNPVLSASKDISPPESLPQRVNLPRPPNNVLSR